MSARARTVGEGSGVFLEEVRRGLGNVTLRRRRRGSCSQVGKSNVVGNTVRPIYKRNFKGRSLIIPLPMLWDWNFTNQ